MPGAACEPEFLKAPPIGPRLLIAGNHSLLSRYKPNRRKGSGKKRASTEAVIEAGTAPAPIASKSAPRRRPEPEGPITRGGPNGRPNLLGGKPLPQKR
jgi:hypothetical protein